MLELFVLAMHIADNMYRPLGEMQQGLQVGDLVHGSVNRGEALRQGTQRRQFWRGKMGSVCYERWLRDTYRPSALLGSGSPSRCQANRRAAALSTSHSRVPCVGLTICEG